MKKQKFITQYLRDLIPVTFELETADELQVIGSGPVQFRATLKEGIPRRELMRSTSLALGEAYMHGKLELDRDLYEVLDLFLGEINKFRRAPWALHGLLHTSLNRDIQEKDVTSHYDIGNDFYKLWLDETLCYSCGYFPTEQTTLHEAQVGKTDHILQKLDLKPGMRLLDIGCGWGFLMERAVERYDVRVVGITLAREQERYLRERIQTRGLAGRMEVLRMDYRDLKNAGILQRDMADDTGQKNGEPPALWEGICASGGFDRIVSVGMIEHVGRGNYGEFLSAASHVLKPGGLFLLHYISAQEEHSGDPWIRKYIFPGGVIPSLREIMNLLPEYRFRTLDVESLRRHYVRTLLCWRDNFLAHRAEIAEQYGEDFTRMWELYLAACAAAFHNGVVDLHQILMSKGINNELPMTRVV